MQNWNITNKMKNRRQTLKITCKTNISGRSVYLLIYRASLKGLSGQVRQNWALIFREKLISCLLAGNTAGIALCRQNLKECAYILGKLCIIVVQSYLCQRQHILRQHYEIKFVMRSRMLLTTCDIIEGILWWPVESKFGPSQCNETVNTNYHTEKILM